VPLQDWIHRFEVGGGARFIKTLAAILGFTALALIYDMGCYHGFSTQEAMESAHLARRISEGRGFSTDSIRPLSLYLLHEGAPGKGAPSLNGGTADVSTPPGYPLLLAGLMKVLPFHFEAKDFWFYQPELWIAIFNQVLFLLCALLTLVLSRRLFDGAVAWMAVAAFTGSELFWKFSVSGLSTLFITLLVLALAWCLVGLDERERLGPAGAGFGRSVAMAVCAGALVGLAGLTRYSFALLILPALAFLLIFVRRGQGWLVIAMTASFLVVFGPWIARNYVLTSGLFGTSGYTLFSEIQPSFPEDRIERSFNPTGSLRRLGPGDVMDKFMFNARRMFEDDVPRLTGSWISAFFLVGLLVPFRNPALRRLRWFVIWSLALLFIAQALGRTRLSADSPQINSDNLLAPLAPVICMMGAGFFFILLDQLVPSHLPEARPAGVAAFAALMFSGYLFALFTPSNAPEFSPYMPAHIQKIAALIKEDELMMSDIPWAVAWYGNRPCAWLTLDDSQEFYRLHKLKPVNMIYLTQLTADRRFLSQMAADHNSWGEFFLGCWLHRQAPDGFPLAFAPSGYLPYQMLLADRPRWQGNVK
jgi:hypothetical protein